MTASLMALVKAFLEHLNRQEKRFIDFLNFCPSFLSPLTQKGCVYNRRMTYNIYIRKAKSFDMYSNCSIVKSLDHRKQICAQRGIKNLSIRSSMLQQAIVVITVTTVFASRSDLCSHLLYTCSRPGSWPNTK